MRNLQLELVSITVRQVTGLQLPTFDGPISRVRASSIVGVAKKMSWLQNIGVRCTRWAAPAEQRFFRLLPELHMPRAAQQRNHQWRRIFELQGDRFFLRFRLEN